MPLRARRPLRLHMLRAGRVRPRIEWRGDLALGNVAAIADLYGVSIRTVRRRCPIVEREPRTERGTGQVFYDAVAAAEHLKDVAARPERAAERVRARRPPETPEPARHPREVDF